MARLLRFLFLSLFLLFSIMIFASDDVVGIWKTINNRKGVTTSIIAVYEFEDTIYGRVIVAFDEKTGDLIDTLYNPSQRIDGKEENSFLCLSNLFWDLTRDGSRWREGTVIDPRNGKTYKCQLWVEDGLLILRGEWGIFGLNQVLYPVVESDYPPGFIVPDIAEFEPVIPVY